MNEETFDEEPVVGDPPPRQRTLLSNTVYDKLKWISLVLLPAFGSLYFGLSPLWDLPNPEEVVGTIVLLDTFFGVVLGISSKQYRDPREGTFVGFLDVTEKRGGGLGMDLQFPGDPLDIPKHDRVTFKVRRRST